MSSEFNDCKIGGEMAEDCENKDCPNLSAANSWRQIQGKWTGHPAYEYVKWQHLRRGNSGAASILIDFVEHLLELIE